MRSARETSSGRGSGRLIKRLRSYRLAGIAMLLLVVVCLIQVISSLAFYSAIDRQSVREDHARRVAELLVVSSRLHQSDPNRTAAVMSTGHLYAAVGASPSTAPGTDEESAQEIKRQIIAWEPSLAARVLHLNIVKTGKGRQDLVGSMQLEDGSWLNFRSRDLSSGWPIALRAAAVTLLITLLAIALGLTVLQRLLNPLRRLSEAADALSRGDAMPVQESGAADLRTLARSINSMQARISGLETDQARSFEAISHDLRTPLSRLKLASEFVSDSEIGSIVNSSADEMEALLTSLQSFLRAQHLESNPETIDLVVEVRSILAGIAQPSTLSAPASAITVSFREPLQLSLRALIQNAVQYGTKADVSIVPGPGSGWAILIEDDGPGIPEDCFDRILDPFFRVDNARARNTAGFGLGIPTAHRLLGRFGGGLEFSNRERGGLCVKVIVPQAPA